MNVAALQENLADITFADIGEEDLHAFKTTSFIQLFRLAQLTIEVQRDREGHTETQREACVLR